jgi:hypothetical protein
MRQKNPPIAGLWRALDEAAFGTQRTLNLRELLPSAAQARARTEVWLRARQVTTAEDVLIITGRGNQSAGGIGVIRQEILGIMPALRRKGIVESWREHSPGSIVVKLAPMSAMLSAPRRRRDKEANPAPSGAEVLTGLEPETLRLLRDLASQNLRSLGVDQTGEFVSKEMARMFSALISALPQSADREAALRESIRNAMDED